MRWFGIHFRDDGQTREQFGRDHNPLPLSTTMSDMYQDHAAFAALAAERLGGEVRAVSLDFSLAQVIRTRGTREEYLPVLGLPPYMSWQTGQPGHCLEYGATQYRMTVGDKTLRVIQIEAPTRDHAPYDLYSCWFVRVADYVALYRCLRRAVRPTEMTVSPPILPALLRKRLWDNTVGFLRGQKTLFERYGVPAKRGLLLLGEPGNGKTLSCRWLRQECARRGLEWRNVSMAALDQARGDGDAMKFFRMEEPGVVLFDDVDSVIRDRQTSGETPLHHVLLSGLDGITPRQGVVFLFTSNVPRAQIDPAFCRPGRIDVVLQFERPDAELRRRVILERWHPDLRAALDIAAAVRQTEGLSFADLEELKKLLVLNFIDSNRWDWETAWSQFRRGRGPAAAPAPIGFGTILPAAAAQPSISGQGPVR